LGGFLEPHTKHLLVDFEAHGVDSLFDFLIEEAELCMEEWLRFSALYMSLRNLGDSLLIS
jgi:hypothetical protein